MKKNTHKSYSLERWLTGGAAYPATGEGNALAKLIQERQETILDPRRQALRDAEIARLTLSQSEHIENVRNASYIVEIH